MSLTQPTWRRRPNGEETVGIHANVPVEVRTNANEVARNLGITLGRYLEILITRDNDIVGENGKPSWADTDLDLVDSIPLPSAIEEHAA